MLKATGRLLLIAFFSLFWMCSIIYMLRYMGANQQYSPVEHPLMNQKKWPIAELQDPIGMGTSSPKLFLYLKLYLSRDSEWIVFEKNTVLNQQKELRPLNALTASELDALGVPTLEKVLAANPGRTFLFYIEDSTVRAFDKIVSLVKKYNLGEKVLIGSNYQVVLSAVRKLEPMWLYGASTPELSKLRFFTSIFLEPLATTNSDFFIFSDIPNDRLVAELRKRKKYFIFKPKDTNLNADISHKSDGLILKDPVILQQLVDQAPSEY
jgi:hypothetical protein